MASLLLKRLRRFELQCNVTIMAYIIHETQMSIQEGRVLRRTYIGTAHGATKEETFRDWRFDFKVHPLLLSEKSMNWTILSASIPVPNLKR